MVGRDRFKGKKRDSRVEVLETDQVSLTYDIRLAS